MPVTREMDAIKSVNDTVSALLDSGTEPGVLVKFIVVPLVQRLGPDYLRNNADKIVAGVVNMLENPS